MKVCMVGEGAFANKHLDAIARIEGVDVSVICGGVAEMTEAVARKRGIGFWTTDLAEALDQPGIVAAILATPTPMHAVQAIQVMKAGKHVLIEIPMADNLADSEELVRVKQDTGAVAMVNHVRRFNPSHQWIHKKLKLGELNLQQLDVQTYFFRRKNINAVGEARSWTDNLLWHHACHAVDLFQHQTGGPPSEVFALQGPAHNKMAIAMDMCIGMKAQSGAVCNLSLSFNNDGPLGSYFRYICDKGTYIARYDDLLDGHENLIDLSEIAVSMDGIELADREFFAAINEGREPNSSVNQCLETMRTLDRVERFMFARA